MSSRDAIVSLVKYAEQAERYENMAEEMKHLILEFGTDPLTIEERNLLSVAFKNVVGSHRSSLRVLTSLAQNEKNENCQVLAEYKKKIEKELKISCQKVLELITKVLEADNTPEAEVFYHKMKGDYYRYLSEFDPTEDNKKNAEEEYKKAEATGKEHLVSTDPILLGLFLNFSVFYYEIAKNQKKACELAKRAFEEAIAEIDTVGETTYKDSTLIMQLLRDNLTLWTSAPESDNDGDVAVAEDEDQEGDKDGDN